MAGHDRPPQAEDPGELRVHPPQPAAEVPPPGELFLDPQQLLALADAISPRYRALVLVAGYTGLRAGEIGALRVPRLDLLRGTLAVQESLAEVKGKLDFGATKTHANRTVRLPRFLCLVLEKTYQASLSTLPTGPARVSAMP